MIRQELISYCAPTLAGLKTGNMICLQTAGEEMMQEIRSLNKTLVKKGLRLIPLRRWEKQTLLYLYRPDELKTDLGSPEAGEILAKKGYPCGDPDRCLAELIRRIASESAFPHEVGLFLGYPPEDVKGFINDPCEGELCVGCWKVYGNPEEAEKIFRRYDKCTAVYRREAEKGSPLERLIVEAQCKRREAVQIKRADKKGA